MSSLSWPPSPLWLSELQRELGKVLRTPLARESGALRAVTGTYSEALMRGTKPAGSVAAPERLAVYNRQYWFRLFTLLHGAFPLFTRLVGHWQMNEYAAQSLAARPPRSWDIDTVVLDFEAFLTESLTATFRELEQPRHLPREALREALALDAAHHRVLRAPEVPEYHPSAADAERLLDGQLRFSPAAAIVSESWPLCELRLDALKGSDESALPLGARLQAPRFWLLSRKQVSLGLLPLAPLEAKLLKLMSAHAVGVALARLEATVRGASAWSFRLSLAGGWLAASS